MAENKVCFRQKGKEIAFYKGVVEFLGRVK